MVRLWSANWSEIYKDRPGVLVHSGLIVQTESPKFWFGANMQVNWAHVSYDKVELWKFFYLLPLSLGGQGGKICQQRSIPWVWKELLGSPASRVKSGSHGFNFDRVSSWRKVYMLSFKDLDERGALVFGSLGLFSPTVQQLDRFRTICTWLRSGLLLASRNDGWAIGRADDLRHT